MQCDISCPTAAAIRLSSTGISNSVPVLPRRRLWEWTPSTWACTRLSMCFKRAHCNHCDELRGLEAAVRLLFIRPSWNHSTVDVPGHTRCDGLQAHEQNVKITVLFISQQRKKPREEEYRAISRNASVLFLFDVDYS